MLEATKVQDKPFLREFSSKPADRPLQHPECILRLTRELLH